MRPIGAGLGRGELRRELAEGLRIGWVMRRAAGQRRARMASRMVMISERPAEVEDLAVHSRDDLDAVAVELNGWGE